MSCPVCGRVMCDCSPAMRGQSSGAMMAGYFADAGRPDLAREMTRRDRESKVSDSQAQLFWESLGHAGETWSEVAEMIKESEQAIRKGIERMLADANQFGGKLPFRALKGYFPGSDDSLTARILGAFSTDELIDSEGSGEEMQVIFKGLV